MSKISGEQEAELREAEVSPDLVEALANQEITAEDIGEILISLCQNVFTLKSRPSFNQITLLAKYAHLHNGPW